MALAQASRKATSASAPPLVRFQYKAEVVVPLSVRIPNSELSSNCASTSSRTPLPPPESRSPASRAVNSSATSVNSMRSTNGAPRK